MSFLYYNVKTLDPELNSQTLKTHQSVDNQLVNSFIMCFNLQANKYLSEKACRYGWKTGQCTSVKYF